MRGDLTFKILERVAEGVVDMATLFLAVVTSPYGASAGNIMRRQEDIQGMFKEGRVRLGERKNFSKLVSKLKKEGLVIKEGKNIAGLTAKGRALFEGLKKKLGRRLPHINQYREKESHALKVIIFDIPEKERYKRRWLREVLRRLKFSKLQQSVWAGKRGIPENLIHDIERLRLADCVEIFEVGKTGSLKKIV